LSYRGKSIENIGENQLSGFSVLSTAYRHLIPQAFGA